MMGVLTMGDETITINDAKESLTFSSFDMVNHPPHYNQSGVECIDAIESATFGNSEDGFENYLQGNIIKYIWRYRYKNGLQDLKKAEWYLNKLINVVNKRYD